MWRLLLFLGLGAPLHADVTIRYRTTVKASEPLATTGADSPDAIRIKGRMGHITSVGFTMIVDFDAQQLTVADTWHLKYASIPASEYAARLASTIPEASAALMKSMVASAKVQASLTGRSDTIQNVRAVEREVRMSVKEPAPMTIVMSVWTAASEEAQRVPALRELEAMSRLQGNLFPGILTGVDGFGELLSEMRKDQSLVLRMRLRIFVGSTESDALAMEMSQEAAEISVAAIDPAIFRIPPDYTAAPFEEVVLGATQARMPANTLIGPGTAELPAPGSVQAYVPLLNPLERAEPRLPSGLQINSSVRLLVTIDPRGNVAQAEPLTGPPDLQSAAVEAVRHYGFQPVLRNGHAVFAYTDVVVPFTVPGRAAGEADTVAIPRLSELLQSMPRSPAQVLADLEQDSEGGDESRRFLALGGIAQAALNVGQDDKAALAATELLGTAAGHGSPGDAIYSGHSVLGMLALRRGDLAAARRELLAAGKTTGSPVLNTLGPHVALAKLLLDRGEKDVVLEFFGECRIFWTSGGQKLDQWTEAVRKGAIPDFGPNLQ